MVKSRFTTIDVSAAVTNIRAKCLGMRASNIYDLNPKSYVIKLALNEKKYSLFLESGTRVHTTKYVREKPKIPSVFTLKLRKHIRTKRLESIQQVWHT
jgi:predicted ribosome quality control (RQC) complex YloA/Tae2 family protein